MKKTIIGLGTALALQLSAEEPAPPTYPYWHDAWRIAKSHQPEIAAASWAGFVLNQLYPITSGKSANFQLSSRSDAQSGVKNEPSEKQGQQNATADPDFLRKLAQKQVLILKPGPDGPKKG